MIDIARTDFDVCVHRMLSGEAWEAQGIEEFKLCSSA
jgi:hypothetical protein